MGGVTYALWGRDPAALDLGCNSDCVHTKGKFPETNFCFAAGNLETRCLSLDQPITTITTTATSTSSVMSTISATDYASSSSETITVISDDPIYVNTTTNITSALAPNSMNPTKSTKTMTVKTTTTNNNIFSDKVVKSTEAQSLTASTSAAITLFTTSNTPSISWSISTATSIGNILTTDYQEIQPTHAMPDRAISSATLHTTTTTTSHAPKDILTLEQKLVENQATSTFAKSIKQITELNISKTKINRKTLAHVKSALFLLQNWFVCLIYQNMDDVQCKSSFVTESTKLNTTLQLDRTLSLGWELFESSPHMDIKTTNTSTNVLTTKTTANKGNISTIQAITSSATNIRKQSELVIGEAKEKKKIINELTSALYILQGLFLTLITANNPEPRSVIAFTLATHLTSSGTGAVHLENNAHQHHPEEMKNTFRGQSAFLTSCEDLQSRMIKVTALLVTYLIQALSLANDLKNAKIADFTCTSDQVSSMNEEVSKASEKASNHAEIEISKIDIQFDNLTTAFDSIIKANEDLTTGWTVEPGLWRTHGQGSFRVGGIMGVRLFQKLLSLPEVFLLIEIMSSPQQK